MVIEEFQEYRIPNRIRTIRKSMNLTLEQLSKKVEMTKAYLSKLERSEKAPPIATLYKIAKALNVDINYLITGRTIDYSKNKVSFVPAEKQLSVLNKRSNYGYIYKALAYTKSNKLMEPFIIVVPPKKEVQPFSHEGEEFNYLIEGKSKMFVAGKFYTMKQGDSIYFESSQPHYAVGLDNKNAVFLQVSIVPKNNINQRII